MWYEMTDKKQWKRYVGYALFLFLSYSIGNAAAVVSTMTLQPEKVEKEMKTVAITFDDGPNPECGRGRRKCVSLRFLYDG